jgi:pentatricopeptide repeat protein
MRAGRGGCTSLLGGWTRIRRGASPRQQQTAARAAPRRAPSPTPPPQAQCTGPSQLRRALALVADMRARGIPLNTHTYSAILNVCIKGGQAELALDVYSQVCFGG